MEDDDDDESIKLIFTRPYTVTITIVLMIRPGKQFCFQFRTEWVWKLAVA